MALTATHEQQQGETNQDATRPIHLLVHMKTSSSFIDNAHASAA
jgi:hypothetical protein